MNWTKVHDPVALRPVEDMSESDSAPALAAPVYERAVSAGVDKGEVESKPVVKKSMLPRVADMTHEQLANLFSKSKTKKFQACAAMILDQGISGEDVALFDADAYEIIQEVTGLSKVFTKKLFRELKSHDTALERNTAGILSSDGNPW